MKSENQREKSEKKSLYFSIYDLLNKDFRPPQILVKLSLKKQKLNYYMQVLKAKGVISKPFYAVWKVEQQLTEVQLEEVLKTKKSKLFSLGTSGRPKNDLHALQINIPILSGKINDSDWEVKEKLRNWIPKYTELEELGGLTIKNNNNKSITLWAKPREVQSTDEVRKLTHVILLYSRSYFKVKYGVDLDTINASVKNTDFATEDKHSESMRGKGDKVTLHLNKYCAKILPNDKLRPAKAWIDGSPYNFSAESNDLDWNEAYLNMPFGIRDLRNSLPALNEYNKNLKLHINVMEDIRKTEKENLKTQKDIQKLLKQLHNKF